jgi:hypothetical protein
VRQIRISGTTTFRRAGGVTLEFTASVNGEHLPLTSYRIDWGDLSAVTEVAGLRISPKSNIADPHIALHTYQCGSGGAQVGPLAGATLSPCTASLTTNCWNGTECLFTPAVQVTDNWGLCNGGSGSACTADYLPGSPVWAPYPGVIRVRP